MIRAIMAAVPRRRRGRRRQGAVARRGELRERKMVQWRLLLLHPYRPCRRRLARRAMAAPPPSPAKAMYGRRNNLGNRSATHRPGARRTTTSDRRSYRSIRARPSIPPLRPLQRVAGRRPCLRRFPMSLPLHGVGGVPFDGAARSAAGPARAGIGRPTATAAAAAPWRHLRTVDPGVGEEQER